jgi:hypothetical protein
MGQLSPAQLTEIGSHHHGIHCRIYQYIDECHLLYASLILSQVLRQILLSRCSMNKDASLRKYGPEIVADRTIVLYAYHGIKLNWNQKNAVLRNLPYLGIACVGIGSTAFHATMKKYTQWCKCNSFLSAKIWFLSSATILCYTSSGSTCCALFIF